jgi:hypothetical protein
MIIDTKMTFYLHGCQDVNNSFFTGLNLGVERTGSSYPNIGVNGIYG